MGFKQNRKTEIVKLAAVGDMMFGDNPLCYGFGVLSQAKKTGYDYLFKYVKHIFQRNDLVVGNLESVIASPFSDEQKNMWSLMNRGIDMAANAMKSSGIDLVGLANNHIYEHGSRVLDRTINNLNTAGIYHVGSKRKQFQIIEKNNFKIAFLSWSLLPDRYWPDTSPSDYYHITDNIDDIKHEVFLVKDKADLLVLLLHWGFEYINQPSSKQQEQAHQLIDAGVNIIFGHHPHVLQPVEEFSNGVIFYSLGNFVFDSWQEQCKYSLIAEIVIDENISYSFVPIIISNNDYVPKIAEEKNIKEVIFSSLETMEILDDVSYAKTLKDYRSEYRKSAIFHVLKNIHRYRKREIPLLLKWAYKRAKYVMRTRNVEYSDPYSIYRGPMKG